MTLYFDLREQVSNLTSSSPPDQVDAALTKFLTGVHAPAPEEQLGHLAVSILMGDLQRKLGWTYDKLQEELGRVQVREGWAEAPDVAK